MEGVVFLAVLMALYFVARLPILSKSLAGEEGIFAALVVYRPPAPDYFLVARIDRQDRYGPLAHPSPLYETLRLASGLWQPVSPEIVADDARATPRLRFFFSLFQCTVWLLVGIAALAATGSSRPFARYATLAIVALTAISPIALATSTQLQLDGSVGSVMVGLAAGALCLASRHLVPVPVMYAVLFLSTVVLGLGKQEWTLAFLGALVLWVGALLVIRRRIGRAIREQLLAGVVIVAGLLLGNWLSYQFNSRAWSGGIHVMRSIADIATVATGPPARWWRVTDQRMGMLVTCGVVGVTLLILFWRRLKDVDPYAFLLLFLTGGLFGGYFITSFAPEVRYFMPSLIVMAFAFVAVVPAAPDRTGRWVLAATTGLLSIHTGVYIVDRIGAPTRPINVSRDPRECIPLMSHGDVWNKPDVDFVGRNLGIENAAAFVARFGKTTCDYGSP